MLFYNPTSDPTKEAILSLVENSAIALKINTFQAIQEFEPLKIGNEWYLKEMNCDILAYKSQSLNELKSKLLTDYYCGKITTAQITKTPKIEVEKIIDYNI